AHAGCAVPVSAFGSRGECLVLGLNELARLVLQGSVRQAVLLGVGVLDVTDGVLQLLHVVGNALVTLATLANRPLHGLAFANLFLPVGRYLGQIVGPAEGRARAVRAVYDDDVGVRQ